MTAQDFIEQLATRGRLLVLGGLAVIAHGLARSTRDADVWLEPFTGLDEWTEVLRNVLAAYPDASPYDLRNRRATPPDNIGDVVARDGVVRIAGLDRALDIFHRPHNMAPEDFQTVWDRAALKMENTRVPEDIDLLVTKEETSRPQDVADVAFLEQKIRTRLSDVLKTCSVQEAEAIFQRYADHATCAAALHNSDTGVQALAVKILREFADTGDPFAERLLQEQQT
jgi:hypothetical protein